jgi:predicted alpha/beta hydrolase family esterase
MKNFIFINGILSDPGKADGWTDRAVTWVHTHSQDRAEKFEYLSGVLTRRLRLNKWAANLARLISRYSGQEVVLVGHSNGCELICRALDLCGVRVNEVHLISGACDACFRKNGLNAAMERGQVGRITVYVAERDLPMRIAYVTRFLEVVGAGYGRLGMDGPLNVSAAYEARVTTVRDATFGHSTWFEVEYFDQLMRSITANQEGVAREGATVAKGSAGVLPAEIDGGVAISPHESEGAAPSPPRAE